MWKWIKKNILRIKPVVIHRDHGGYGETEAFKPIWGFIAPHTRKDGGAYSDRHRINEYNWAHKMYDFMIKKIPVETRDDGGVKGAVKRLGKRGVNASIENHKNAYNKKAKGFEVLYLEGDELSREYALKLVEAVREHFPKIVIRRGNGLVAVTSRGRGGYNLTVAKRSFDVALLTEFFFIDNYKDYKEPEAIAQFWDSFLN